MFYEFFIYGPKRHVLEDTRDALVGAFEFDPNTAIIRRSAHTWNHTLARVVLGWFGRPQQDDWLLTITGPETNRADVHRLIGNWGGFCDGGGYDFTYDPSTYYTEEQIRRHTERWEREREEAEALLSSDEREWLSQGRAALEELMREEPND